MTTQTKQLSISHAPGPYFYQRGTDGCDDTWAIIAQPDQRYVATIHYWDDDDGLEGAATEANARLLTAAPNMFDALKAIVEAFDGLDVTVTNGPVFLAIRLARYAVAEVDGKVSFRAC